MITANVTRPSRYNRDDGWKDRFRKEWADLSTNINKLVEFLKVSLESNHDFAASKEYALRFRQLEHMQQYLADLEELGEFYGIWKESFSGRTENDKNVPDGYFDMTELLNSAGK